MEDCEAERLYVRSNNLSNHTMSDWKLICRTRIQGKVYLATCSDCGIDVIFSNKRGPSILRYKGEKITKRKKDDVCWSMGSVGE